MADSTQPYDSGPETRKHMARIEELLEQAAAELQRRGSIHDKSKLEELEKPYFDRLTPSFANVAYGSLEYLRVLKELGPALDHHYANNSHHPEHYPNGVDGMTLFDIIEMFLDWKATSERHMAGDLSEGLEHNAERFNLSPQLVHILENTAKYLGWIEDKPSS